MSYVLRVHRTMQQASKRTNVRDGYYVSVRDGPKVLDGSPGPPPTGGG